VALERELGAVLGLRVILEQKKRGGSLTIHYASLDQLDGILHLLRADKSPSPPFKGGEGGTREAGG
jgi:ParB family chromosome partitioning protein